MGLVSELPAVASLRTPVGPMSVAVTEVGLDRVRWGSLTGVTRPDVTSGVLDSLNAYFTGERTPFDMPLDLRGLGETQCRVLRTLAETVGYGESVTYGELAARSGTGVPARAIGAIMGSNPLPIVLPCHRVLAHDGLGGYSGGTKGTGLDVKRWLLTLEGVLPPTLDWNPAGL